ncbi:MAG: hypothetical protein ACREHD_17675 [Pirellulales bacterium]
MPLLSAPQFQRQPSAYDGRTVLTGDVAKIDEFCELVAKSGLVKKDTIASVRSAANDRSADESASPAVRGAQYLLQRGELTVWQAARLLNGQWRGFFIGNYKIVEHLGDTGRSVAYRGVNLRLNKDVVLKVLPPHLAQRAQLLEFWQCDAAAQTRLATAYVVPIYDVVNEGMTHFLVREYINGTTLKEVLAVNRDGLHSRWLARWGAQLVDATLVALDGGCLLKIADACNIIIDGSANANVLGVELARTIDPSRTAPDTARGHTSGFIRPAAEADATIMVARMLIVMLTGDTSVGPEASHELWPWRGAHSAPEVLRVLRESEDILNYNLAHTRGTLVTLRGRLIDVASK